MRTQLKSKTMVYDPVDMAGRPPLTPATECGTRLSSFRKAASLSQSELASSVGIPQRTLSFYERKADHLPSNLLPRLATVLGVSIDDLLGLSDHGKKRGPKSKLERQFEAVQNLPRTKQKFVSEFLDTMLSQANWVILPLSRVSYYRGWGLWGQRGAAEADHTKGRGRGRAGVCGRTCARSPLSLSQEPDTVQIWLAQPTTPDHPHTRTRSLALLPCAEILIHQDFARAKPLGAKSHDTDLGQQE